MKTIAVTKLEKLVLEALAKGMYAELGFSDMGLPELREDTGLTNKVLRGVGSSLIKKGLIDIWDREGDWGVNHRDADTHIWYLTPDTQGLVDHWVEEEGLDKVVLVENN